MAARAFCQSQSLGTVDKASCNVTEQCSSSISFSFSLNIAHGSHGHMYIYLLSFISLLRPSRSLDRHLGLILHKCTNMRCTYCKLALSEERVVCLLPHSFDWVARIFKTHQVLLAKKSLCSNGEPCYMSVLVVVIPLSTYVL